MTKGADRALSNSLHRKNGTPVRHERSLAEWCALILSAGADDEILGIFHSLFERTQLEGPEGERAVETLLRFFTCFAKAAAPKSEKPAGEQTPEPIRYVEVRS